MAKSLKQWLERVQMEHRYEVFEEYLGELRLLVSCRTTAADFAAMYGSDRLPNDRAIARLFVRLQCERPATWLVYKCVRNRDGGWNRERVA